MKRRFSIIEKRLDRNPREAARIFTTCACLHNFALERGDMFVDNNRVVNLNNDIFVDEPEDKERHYQRERDAGAYIRRELVNYLLVHGNQSFRTFVE